MQTNLKQRVIPVIQYFNYQIVKSRSYTDYRTIGSLEMTVDIYNKRRVDELIIVDSGASKQNESVNSFVLKILSKNCLMPVTFGGGIKTLFDIEECLKNGCDKVILNSEILRNPEFAKQATKTFGSQCIVASIDYTEKNGSREIYSHADLDVSNINFDDFVKQMNDYQVGEIYLTNIDKEGWEKGMDTEIVPYLEKNLEVDLPLLVYGGASTPEHIHEAFKSGASAVCASSIFLFSQYGYRDIKTYLSEQGDVPIRLGFDPFF